MPLSPLSTLTRFWSPGTASRALVVLAVAGSALGLGALHTPVLCAVAALLGTATFLTWYRAAPVRARLPATILVVTGVALTTFTALQALPLPAAFVGALSPATADIWKGALAAMREPGPRWTPLSLEPLATHVEVLRGVTYLATFLTCLRICDRRGGSRFIAGTIVITALALAIAAMLHPAFGAERVFGIYRPENGIAERHIAPLLNPNHLAAYLNIGFCLALGMALDSRLERVRPIAIAIALLLVATQIWVASRGGLLAMLFGTICTLLMAHLSRRFAHRKSMLVLVPVLAVAAGLAMIVVGLSPDAIDELHSGDVSKVRIALDGLRLVPNHALFGVGRGAYEVAFPAVRTNLGFSVVTHPENIIVQWLTEWGLPATLLAFGALGFSLRPQVVVVSSNPAIGAWSAIVTTLVHNLVDFNSEVPAIGVALAACAAMVVAGHGNERPGIIHKWSNRPRRVAVTVSLTTAACIAVALLGWRHELDEERRALYARVVEPELSAGFQEDARDALLRHPSEPYIPFIASIDSSRRGRSVVPWIERTLALAPVYGPAHFVLAQQLAPLSPSQARLEYKLAITQGYDLPLAQRAIELGSRLVNGFDDAQELLSEVASTRQTELERLVDALKVRLPGSSERLEEVLEKQSPDARTVIERSLNDLMADIEAGPASPWCDGEYACVEQGLSSAARLRAMDPGACTPMIASARLLISAGRAADGLHSLRGAAQTASDPLTCWRALGRLALDSRNDVYIQVAEDEVARSGCSSDTECANNLVWVGALEEQRGNPRKAVTFYQRAHERASDREDIAEHWATLTSSLGMHAQALEAYRALEGLSHDTKWQAAADREKNAVFHEQVVR